MNHLNNIGGQEDEGSVAEQPVHQPLIADKTPYESRLKKQGLPLSPLPNSWTKPSRFQLAHLAATLDVGERGSTGPVALVERALRLWHGTCGERFAVEQAGILARGLLHYEVEDWQMHALNLVFAVQGSIYPSTGIEELARMGNGNMRNRAQKRPQKSRIEVTNVNGSGAIAAGMAVERIWRSYPFTNGDVLNMLFFRKDEYPKKLASDFFKLLKYAKRAIGIEKVQALSNADIRQRKRRIQLFEQEPDELDVFSVAIRQAWYPLSGWDKNAAWCVAELARLRLDVPEVFATFALGRTLAESPRVARWLAVMRQDQRARGKNGYDC